jgi:hypothetical protein
MILDLSSNNAHPINYAAVKGAGVTGVIVKATDGTSYTNPYFHQDVAGFQAVGVPVLGYHFAEFGNVQAEVNHFKSVAGPLARVLDSETNTNATWQNAFLSALGLWPNQRMNYGSASSLPRTTSLLWVADYGANPGFGDCWQFTETGHVAGISGNVDLSTWTGSTANFNSLFGVATPAPPPTPPPPTVWTVKPLTGQYGHLNAPVVALVPTPTGNGYTEVASDGGTFAYGDAKFIGSLAGHHLNAPIVGAAGTATGKGLLMVATDGGVFAFGDAPYFGSMGGHVLNAPVIDIDITPTGKGYWLTGADGGIFNFGDAHFEGSPA